MIFKINGKIVDKKTWEASTEDGIHQIFYHDQTLKYETPYINDQPHGIEKSYYEDGTLEYETSWVNGLQHGIEKWYHEDGAPKSQDLWVNGDCLGPPEQVLKEKGKLWILITLGPEILRGVSQILEEV